MLRLVSDANVPRAIVRGLRTREPGLDLVRVEEVGLRTAADPVILEWAAAQARIVFSFDRKTLVGYAYDRVNAGLPMLGVLMLSKHMTYREAIEEILIAAMCHTEDELKDRVIFLPL